LVIFLSILKDGRFKLLTPLDTALISSHKIEFSYFNYGLNILKFELVIQKLISSFSLPNLNELTPSVDFFVNF